MEPAAPENNKVYYSIREVAEMLNVNQSLIRFWDKEFSINPAKNKKGNRMFTPKDIDKLKLVYHLVKDRGMTLKGAKAKLKTTGSELNANFELIKRLQTVKKELLQIKKGLENFTPGQE